MSASLALEAVAALWGKAPGPIFCAVSGGLDSMVLLHALARHREWHERSRSLAVLHVNHGLRGRESDGDETLVRKTADKFGLPFFGKKLAWESEKTSQALCREKRFAFFYETLPPGGRIFLAHHQGDQAETILLRLLRGTGLRGLRGMAVTEGALVRPFLALSRDQLAAAAAEWKVKWREDSSNQSLKYERNWLRAEVMPLLEARRPGAANRIAALAEEVRGSFEAMPEPSFFALAPGWRLYRRDDLRSASALSHHFSLNRARTKNLVELLQRKSGRLDAGTRFVLSAGLLLAGRGEFSLPPVERRERKNEVVIATALGEWVIPANVKWGFQAELSLGDRLKKEFQRKRVPIFFRDQLPILPGEKISILLPGIDAPNVKSTPSPLAQWWNT
jgi:tRNA(Ile)-lysidine synthetase-like protein